MTEQRWEWYSIKKFSKLAFIFHESFVLWTCVVKFVKFESAYFVPFFVIDSAYSEDASEKVFLLFRLLEGVGPELGPVFKQEL